MPIKLTGMDQLIKKIQKVKNEKALLKLACREGAKMVAQEIIATIPVKTGALKRAVKVRAKKKGIGASAIIGLPGTDEYPGWFLEHGTKERYSKKGKFSGRIAAMHIAANALKKVAGAVFAKIKEIVSRKIWQ